MDKAYFYHWHTVKYTSVGIDFIWTIYFRRFPQKNILFKLLEKS